jgi:putative flippase GtrA
MKPIIFKKEGTFFHRIEAWGWSLLDLPFIRFLIAGGLNTALGYGTTLLLRYTVFIDHPKWILPFGGEIDAPNTIMFLLLFPVSYTIQALFAFKTTWSWKRLLLYPLSSIPNYGIQQTLIYIFESVFGIPFEFSYALSAVFAIPLMFVIIKFLVVKKR